MDDLEMLLNTVRSGGDPLVTLQYYEPHEILALLLEAFSYIVDVEV